MMMPMRNRRSTLEDFHALFHLGAMGVWADGKLVRHFLSGQSGCEGAFRVLLHRHGPMVLSACRRVLGDSHAADDAFQATFLVLVKKARSIRDREVLTGWLHGVAVRVSRKAKARAYRRRVVEQQAAEQFRVAEEQGDPDRAELRALIDEEIRQLPARYRDPLVLCYLEGLRHHEIAERLACPVGTVESRLSRGRERLRTRLVRRGLAPTASVLGAAVLSPTASAAVPRALVEATLQGAFAISGRLTLGHATRAAALASATLWPKASAAVIAGLACVGLATASLIPRAETVGPTAEAATPINPSTPITRPRIEPKPPNPPPLPSRADSALAGPLAGITIDGYLDDWPANLPVYPIAQQLRTYADYDPTPRPERTPNFRAGYDRATGRIYLAVEVPDDEVVAPTGNCVTTDAVEIYVDGLGSNRSIPNWPLDASLLPVVQYVGVPARHGAYLDPRNANPSLLYGRADRSTTTMAYQRQGSVTTYEWAIQPFDHYPDQPTRLEPGKRIGLDVVVVDKDSDRARPSWLGFAPPPVRFKGCDAGSLGELILLDEFH
jgi:RNA polymerase sigma factor (sigma-70 family)